MKARSFAVKTVFHYGTHGHQAPLRYSMCRIARQGTFLLGQLGFPSHGRSLV